MTSPEEAISLLVEVATQFKTTPHLYVFARMSAAFYQLRAGSLVDAKSAIDECSPLVDGFTGVDPEIRAIFYRVKAENDKAKAAFSGYYRDALLYLACVKVEEIPKEEALAQAHDLCVAALLGDTVYNFGELLMHPILLSLRGSPFEYLEHTLNAFNSGNHQQFDALVHSVSSNPVLAGRLDFLRQKICLMALVETVFAHLKISRQLSLDLVAQKTRVPATEVEYLLMKALSLGLLRGSIDEVKQIIEVDWVQPRVLDREQLGGLRASIQAWKQKVSDIGKTFDVGTLAEINAEC